MKCPTKCRSVMKIVCLLVVIGALNWGLVGFFGFDLVATIFGDMSAVSRVIYALVGVAGLLKLKACLCRTCKGGGKCSGGTCESGKSMQCKPCDSGVCNDHADKKMHHNNDNMSMKDNMEA